MNMGWLIFFLYESLFMLSWELLCWMLILISISNVCTHLIWGSMPNLFISIIPSGYTAGYQIFNSLIRVFSTNNSYNSYAGRDTRVDDFLQSYIIIIIFFSVTKKGFKFLGVLSNIMYCCESVMRIFLNEVSLEIKKTVP